MKRIFTLVLTFLLLVISIAPGVALTASPALAASTDHFRPSSPNPFVPTDDLSTPTDFEAAAAAHPDPNGFVLVSRCRFTPFTASFYSPITGGVVDVIKGDKTFSFSDGSRCYEPQNEHNIVVNPTNENNVITSSNDYRFGGQHEVYSSMDGGITWTNVVLPGWTTGTGGQGVFARLGWCGDPVVAFGPDGTAYYSGLVCNGNKVAFFSGVAVASSHDGGLSWGAPVMVSFNNSPVMFNDKEFMTVGPDGKIYVTWTRFKVVAHSYAASPIVLATSSDGGVSWSDWVSVSDPSHPFNQGSTPLVAPDGTLYVAYEGSTPSTGFAGDAIIVAHSTDGGKSFTNTEVARVYDDYNCYPINVAQGRQTLSGEQFRISSFPSFAIDPTNGKLAITWADDQANASCGFEKGGSFVGPTKNQVKLITSPDGLTWSSPRVITPDTHDEVYPAVGANDGRIYISYYTRAYSPSTADCKAMVQDTTNGNLITFGGPVCLDFAFRSSSDNFASETRLTNQSSNPYITFAGAFIGDYTGAVINSSGSAFSAWADFRGNPGVTLPNMDEDVAVGK